MARIRVREGAAYGLRRRARTTHPAEPGWILLEIAFVDAQSLAEEVAGYGADAVVEAPDEVVRNVVELLRAAAGQEVFA